MNRGGKRAEIGITTYGVYMPRYRLGRKTIGGAMGWLNTLAKISVKSHHNGSLNPKAHLRKEITIEDVMKAPTIAWPPGLLDCCGVSDGAAAAIFVRADKAKEFRPDPIYVKAIQICADSGASLLYSKYDYTHVETTYRAAIKAYEEAGVKHPRGEIGMMEVHD